MMNQHDNFEASFTFNFSGASLLRGRERLVAFDSFTDL